VTRYLKAGERLRTATTEFSATNMVDSKKRGAPTCGASCSNDLNRVCLCKQVDDRSSGYLTNVSEDVPAEFHYLGSSAQGRAAGATAAAPNNMDATDRLRNVHISLGGKEDAPELASELSSAFIADTTTDEMCVGSDDDLEEHLARIAMHWLDEGRSSPGNLVGGGDTESSDDRMSLQL
jgi:hypothetical protein